MKQELPQTNSDYYVQANGSYRVEYGNNDMLWYTPNFNTDYDVQYELSQQIAEAEQARQRALAALRAAQQGLKGNESIFGSGGTKGGNGSGSGLAGTGGGNHVGGADYASVSDPEKVDWVAVRINRIERAIADLEKIASSGFKKLDTRLRAARDQISKTTDQIKVMNSAYDRYIQEANSVGLSENIAHLVREGTIDINSYDDETRKQIDEYTEW